MHALGAARGMQLRDRLDHFRRRGPRIARDHTHARLERGVGEGLVAHQ